MTITRRFESPQFHSYETIQMSYVATKEDEGLVLAHVEIESAGGAYPVQIRDVSRGIHSIYSDRGRWAASTQPLRAGEVIDIIFHSGDLGLSGEKTVFARIELDLPPAAAALERAEASCRVGTGGCPHFGRTGPDPSEAVRELTRAIALDRAYQISGDSCSWCGVPAVRSFVGRSHHDGLKACAICAPKSEEEEHDGDSAPVLSTDSPETLHQVPTADLEDRKATVRINSIPGRRWWLWKVDRANPTSVRSADEGIAEGVLLQGDRPGSVWCRTHIYSDKIVDHPKRPAIERLLKISRGEEGRS